MSSQPRLVAIGALASICLAAGCGDDRLINDRSAAADIGDGAIVTVPVAPTASAGPSAPVDAAPGTVDVVPPSSLPTLAEVLADERFVALSVALERSGLDIIIEGLDSFVLLAPTSAAFASAGTDVGIDFPTLMNDTRLLEAVIRYHVVANPSENESWRTLNGAFLDVDAANAGTIDGVDVVERIPVRDGVVLVMPQLLLPASQPDNTAPEADG
jgi:uncharacterized surface protein with fasciclin (FAS1) repeats